MGITSVGVEGSGGISLLSSKDASSRWPTLPFFCIFPVPLPPFREDVTSSSVPEVKLRVCPGLPTSEVDDELGVSGILGSAEGPASTLSMFDASGTVDEGGGGVDCSRKFHPLIPRV